MGADTVVAASRLLEFVETWPVFSPALVLLARVGELSEEPGGSPTLGEIRNLLELAASGEALGGDAELELAHFVSAVGDDDAGALAVIERALKRKEAECIALHAYRVRLYKELAEPEAARRCLEEARQRFPAAAEWLEVEKDLVQG